jgi:hypothetical protein
LVQNIQEAVFDWYYISYTVWVLIIT